MNLVDHKARQELVAHRLEMFERIDPEGAALIREELSFWRERAMNQAETITKMTIKEGRAANRAAEEIWRLRKELANVQLEIDEAEDARLNERGAAHE